MIMCSNCHKRVAVIFVTKVENGEKASQGLCIKCAKDMGLPIENMMGDALGKMGLTPEQLAGMENDFGAMMAPEETDDVDLPEDEEVPF